MVLLARLVALALVTPCITGNGPLRPASTAERVVVPVWKASHEDEHSSITRRLAGSSAEVEGTLSVIRNDCWNDHATVEVIANVGGTAYKVYLEGTNGNQGYLMQNAGLKQGMTAMINGAVMTDASEADKLRQKLDYHPGCAPTAILDTAGSTDTRQVMVVSQVSEILAAGAATADQGAGTAPAILTALVILVHPCGLTVSVDAATVQKAMFDTDNPDTWASTYATCSRSKSTVSGKVIGPIEVCPTTKKDLTETWAAVEAVLKASHTADYNAHTYKVLLQPDEWQTSIGSGQSGGTVSWVRQSYYRDAAMFLHEVGHNLFLHHAGAYGGAEYGDSSSPMGFCCAKRCYHFIHSWQLGFSDVAQTVQPASIPSGTTILDIDIKELGLHADSGIIVPESGYHLVFSYRGKAGFDSFMSSQFQNQVYVHRYEGMGSKKSTHVTGLLSTLTHGNTMLIPGSPYKLTWHATVDSTAKVRLCQAGGNYLPCGTNVTGSSAGGTGGSTGFVVAAPSPAAWTSYFSEEQVASETTSLAMVGIGVKGQYADEVRTGHSDTIRVDLTKAIKKLSVNNVADLSCEGSMAIARVSCFNTNCGRIEVECAPVMGGKLITTALGSSEFSVPPSLHATGDGVCPTGSVVTSIICSGTDCAKKDVTCQRFDKSACSETETCSALGMTCSVDGCGEKCGTCASASSDSGGILTGAAEMACLGGSGRCVAMGVNSDWFSKSKDMPVTGLAASGMSCRGHYCDEGRLTLMGVMLNTKDTIQHYSGWISDNVGAKWPWNDATADLVAECPEGMVVTRIECRGRYCDDLRLQCAPPVSWKVDPLGRPWAESAFFSEEGDGRQDCPRGFAMVGLECEESKTWCLTKCGDYCDNKRIRCRQMTVLEIGSKNEGIADTVAIGQAMQQSADCDEQCRWAKTIAQAVVDGAVTSSAFYAFALSLATMLAVL